MAEADRPTFYYDFYSPYSYLAAERVNALMPVVPEWRPISFGHILQRSERRPWSFERDAEHEEHRREIERRVAERGLPELRWPPGWPVETYSIVGARAASFAKASGRAVAFSLACFRQVFAAGRVLDEDTILLAGAACELHPRAVLKGIGSRNVKDDLRAATDAAFERGVRGVPTVAVGDELFWGDDRLEDAAAAAAV